MLNSLFLILGGIAAGIVNTLAGNGSVITLALCTELVGLSPSVANGTNRLGVLMQSISGTLALKKHGKLSLTDTWKPMICVIVGAIFGIWLATALDDVSFKKLYPWFLLFIFLVLLIKPQRWIQNDPSIKSEIKWYLWPILFLIGVYGGLIQIGVGVFFLAAMIMIGHFPWINANAAKIVVVGIFTTFAVVLFGMNGLIHMQTALFLALGQAIGAWLGVRYMSKYPQAQKVSFFLLLVVTAFTLIRQFVF
ncbi:MAG: sulfite exporter TauE/SafE family protein [Saprospiraceae bacterium]